MIAPELEGFASGLLAMGTATAKAARRTDRRTARRRPEEMTVPGEKGVGVLLAESVQKVVRPVSRELLPLPIPFPVYEVVKSERMRGLSRSVKSRVKRRVGWQGWANAGVRLMNEIFGKTATSEARGRPSAMQISSLSRICDAYRGISAADCRSVSGYTGNGVKQATFKEGLVSLPDLGAEMADAFLTGSDFEAWKDWRQVLLRSPSELHEVIAREGRVAPHADPVLKRKPQCYARNVRDMSLRGLVSSGRLRPPSEFLWSRRN